MTSQPLPAPLVVRTVEIAHPAGVRSLLDLLPSRGAISWVRRGDGLVGWGEAARLDLDGTDPMADAERWWQSLSAGAVVRDDLNLPGTGPVAFGTFVFDPRSSTRRSALVVPRTVVGRRAGRWWITTQAAGHELPGGATLPDREPVVAPEGITFADGARDSADWERVVAEAVRRITAGRLEKVVLARDLLAEAAAPIDLRAPLHRLAQRYPRCWTFAVDGLLGATPELLVRRERGLVTSRVLAGTIRRTGDDDRDLALAASLARSSKDLEEHEYAVRSVADALAPHCTSMSVPESPSVLHLPNVMHLASDIAGVAADDVTSLGLARSLHPSAAVGGTPTDAALDLIREIEGMDRGRYAGPVGWTDASGDGEWGIALRCAEVDAKDPSRMRLFAGCGVVADSDPAAELAESNAKLVPMRDALNP